MSLETVLTYLRSNRDRYTSELAQLIAIPSISTERPQEVTRAAQFIEAQLKGMGMENVAVVEGKEGELPLVRADWLKAGDDAPTVLLYAHFDVQPVDPIDQWISPPFELTERDGKFWARGSGDDKGQLFILVKVLEAFLNDDGKLPVNVKIVFEGEEEHTGAHVERYVHEKASELGCSLAIVLDSGMFEKGLPTICTGLRGIVTTKITCKGTSTDVHSGVFGGAAPNAVEALTHIISKLKNPDGTVAIPGFYDKVVAPTAAGLASWEKLPFTEEGLVASLGARALTGDKRFGALHRTWARPTLELNGITGGYAGDGFKTVIASTAQANISMRLVPDMDPKEIGQMFEQYIAKIAPPEYHVTVRILEGARAMVVDTGHPFIEAAAAAFAETFGRQCAFTREGGSIPIAGSFKEVLAVPVLITGFTLPDCNMHAPNENMDVENFFLGMEAIANFFSRLGDTSKKA